MNILIVGGTGMLGYAMVRTLTAHRPDWSIRATLRTDSARRYFPEVLQGQLITGVDATRLDGIVRALAEARPAVVINCVGIVKQLAAAKDPLHVVPLNTMLPHQLARLCDATGARLIHISTDCVYRGDRGNYVESDIADAEDLYGMSKYWGEVDYPNAITLRTSIIGHELAGNRSLIDWFLSQTGPVQGFTRAIFSGLPCNELARVIADRVIPRPVLHGLYHVAAAPISKNDLLKLVRDVYGHGVEIEPTDRVAIDRSLNAQRFAEATGYVAPPWEELIREMYRFRENMIGG